MKRLLVLYKQRTSHAKPRETNKQTKKSNLERAKRKTTIKLLISTPKFLF